MSVPRPVLDEQARAALDEIDHPLSVASAIRDRAGDLSDFRLDFVNVAAATWTGQARDAVIGRRVGDLLPALRREGLFEELVRVVETGEPFRRAGVQIVDADIAGHDIAGRFDMGALRLGDGYLSVWQDIGDGDSTSEQLDLSLRRARAVIRLIRLEFRAPGPLAMPRLAT